MPSVTPVPEIVPAGWVDGAMLRARIRQQWAGEFVVAHGELIYPERCPGFAALLDGVLAGHAAYRIAGRRCELVSIESDPPGCGIGSALLSAVTGVARAAGCATLWCTTTNDNLDALRFYQRRGFRLVALRSGAVDEARATRKPEIPMSGPNGIPIRDEVDLELEL
jgi:GNAT superfamily N-acetyltransferase